MTSQQKSPRKWKVRTFLVLWACVSTYFAAFEVDDRLRAHYNQDCTVSVDAVADMIKDTPAGKELP